MSVTTWTRLEPDTMTGNLEADLEQGVTAALADPLWLIGRQWQLRELTGEDAGSPVQASIRSSAALLDRILLPHQASFDRGSMIAEELVERAPGLGDVRTRKAGWTSFGQRLAEAQLTAEANRVASAFPEKDGDVILAKLDAGTLAAKLGASGSASFTEATNSWAAWYRPRAATDRNGAWDGDSFTYTFGMTAHVAGARARVDVAGHDGGRLDWDSFAFEHTAPSSGTGPQSEEIVIAPALLDAAGMPSAWFWEFEDPRADLGRIETAPNDVGRLLIVETLMAFAADWYLVPVSMPTGSLARIEDLRVTDTFGVSVVIRPVEEIAPDPQWGLWTIGDAPYLLVPPPESVGLVSEPVEEWALVRDEAANLAWAIRRVPEALPRPISADAPAAPDADFVYEPMAPVEPNRIPLTLAGSGPGRRFKPVPLFHGSTSQLLSDLIPANLELADDTLPEEGLTLQRRYKFARDADGKAHLWIETVKTVGAVAPSAGIAFDRLVNSFVP